jgi:hypothetical protein
MVCLVLAVEATHCISSALQASARFAEEVKGERNSLMFCGYAVRAHVVLKVLAADAAHRNLGSGAAKLVAVLLGLEAPQDGSVANDAGLKYSRTFMQLGVSYSILQLLEELKRKPARKCTLCPVLCQLSCLTCCKTRSIRNDCRRLIFSPRISSVFQMLDPELT